MNHYIRWCCRRGVLELDLLLERFLENHFSTLTADEKLLFGQFLQCEDSWLQSWLLLHDKEPPEPFKALVAMILEH